jgi:hypothetical protein
MLELLANVFSRSGSAEDPPQRPTISLVLVVYKMASQAEKTIRSLMVDYQRGVRAEEYEVIIVENESPELIRPEFLQSLPANFSYYLRRDAEPSPGPAVNFGAAKTSGNHICILIDGARMLTPGAVKNMILGHRIGESSVVSSPGYHLGRQLQQEAVESGYCHESERDLLDSIGWPEDGYRLFEIACLNGSSGLGFFLPISESNCISMPRRIWDAIGGYDIRFNLGGGGLINLDFYKRACEHAGVQHVVLPGEGSFHQFHGGITTGGQDPGARQAYIEASNQQYLELRGSEYQSPVTNPIYLGEIPTNVQRFVLYSAQKAIELEGVPNLGKPC